MILVEIKQNLQEWAKKIARPVKLMEVCGTHTMAAFRSGVRSLLPDNITLISGPGCPVCVTAIDYIDHAIRLAQQPDVIVTTFGDMLRVPGSKESLEMVKAKGGEVQVVYSPLDALQAAEKHPDKQIVFLGIGFETTAPTVAWTIQEAAAKKMDNYSVFCAHKTMPQAMKALLQSGEAKIDGFICPGHVSVIVGARIYEFIARDFKVPCVVAGFEPFDILQAIAMLVQQVSEGRAEVGNQYHRSVTQYGNNAAQALLAEVFEASDAVWRGLGTIPGSGLKIRPAFKDYAAETKFAFLKEELKIPEPKGCRCSEVLRGLCFPYECSLYNRGCLPSHPVGPCMVSGEGTCAAYYRYARSPRKQ